MSELRDHFRVAYLGTTASNLTQLVQLRRAVTTTLGTTQGDSHGPSLLATSTTHDWHGGHNPLQSQTSPATASRPETQLEESMPLHVPYPQIRPLKPWHCASQHHLYPSEELATDVSSFPVQEVRDALVQAYFDHIHPGLPVVSKSTLVDVDGTLRKRPPLLLLQAVLLAGTHACSHPRVEKDRRMVQSVLFRRASMLFHLRHETDRLHLAQAALLFTWYIHDGDTVAGGPWYWTGEAIRIACGLGLHRHNTRLPTLDRIIYKRLWWSAFVAEVFASLEMGRPCAVRADDIDQSPLCEEEFSESARSLPSTDRRPGEATTPAIPLHYHRSMVELAYIALEVLSLNAPGTAATAARPDIQSIDGRLALWALRSGVSTERAPDDFWTWDLRIHHQLVVLHFHRNHNSRLENSQKVCETASSTIIDALERIAERGLMKRCRFTVVGAVTAAGIQVVQDIRSAINSHAHLIAINLLDRLKKLLGGIALLAKQWPNAEALYNVFDGLWQDYQARLSQNLHQIEQVKLPEPQTDWNELFTSMQFPVPAGGRLDQDWSCLTEWNDLM